MELDKETLRDGLKYIVGTWEADFIVSFFSDDLAHIPAAEFKDDKGHTFTDLKFTFYEDHTLVVETGADNPAHNGSWEQTGYSEYRYDIDDFAQIPDGYFKEATQTLQVQEGHLVFALGFLAVAMKKIAEGTVTEEPAVDVSVFPFPEDKAADAIVGQYRIAKMLGSVGDQFGMFSKAELAAEQARLAAAAESSGEDGEAGYDDDLLSAFDTVIEFTSDHRVLTWMKLPAGVSEEEIRAAIEAGQISEVRDGMFTAEEYEWKAAEGKFYYNTGRVNEIFGEAQSPWAELAPDDAGLIKFAGGLYLIERI
jgi:hypothetical protein